MKGQNSNIIVGLFMLLIVLLVFGSLIGDINTAITNLIPELDTSTATLIQLLPFTIAIVILTAVIGGKMSKGILD